MKTQDARGGLGAVEWPTLALIVICYGAWLGIGLLVWPAWPAIAIVLLGIVLALQASLMHEVCHGHPTRNARINEALVFLPLGLVWPYRRFRSIHLRHHADARLTDPFDDPESYYQALWRYEAMPAAMKLLLRVNNTMVGRLLLNPWLGSIGFFVTEAGLMLRGARAVRRAWLLHAAGLVTVAPVIVFLFDMPLWLYVVGPVWIGQALISVRTYAEHQWSERPDGRTIIVERSPLALLFLNNNLHLVHHTLPQAPWYRLPKLFAERRREWIDRNEGYVFPNYFALFRSFAFRAKEPVAHPVLRRASEPGRAFRPRQRSRGVGGIAGTSLVPARPPKE
ncbi:MAG: fatty acid desaturase [Nitratireductor sp.]